MTLQIKRSDLKEIVLDCDERSPLEACGILAGRITHQYQDVQRKVLEIYSCRNELNSTSRYELGAEEQYEIFRQIDDLDLDLIGFYHSHPHSDSRPSTFDREIANYYGYAYVIVSLRPREVRSWILEKKGIFEEEEIRIV